MGTAANLHLAGWTPELVDQAPTVSEADGCFAVPDRPGHRIKLNNQACAPHPRAGARIELFEPGWELGGQQHRYVPNGMKAGAGDTDVSPRHRPTLARSTLSSSNTWRSLGASNSMAAVDMASGKGAPGRGWVREDEVRATLSAIEGELASAMRPPRKLAGSRLLRLRLMLLAVESSDLPLEGALRGLRAALRRPPPPLA